MAMYSALFGLNGVSFEGLWQWGAIGQLLFLVGLGAVALFAPNVMELFHLSDTKLRGIWKWTRFDTNYRWAAFTILILGSSVLLILSHRVSEFLYFEF